MALRDNPEKMKEYKRDWMRKRRSEFFQNKKCINCGSKEELQLHHRIPEDKDNHRIWSWSKDRQRKEISKCDILCQKCHKSHHKRISKKSLIHGTDHGYRKHKCRCDECKKAHAIYNLPYNKKSYEKFKTD